MHPHMRKCNPKKVRQVTLHVQSHMTPSFDFPKWSLIASSLDLSQKARKQSLIASLEVEGTPGLYSFFEKAVLWFHRSVSFIHWTICVKTFKGPVLVSSVIQVSQIKGESK